MLLVFCLIVAVCAQDPMGGMDDVPHPHSSTTHCSSTGSLGCQREFDESRDDGFGVFIEGRQKQSSPVDIEGMTQAIMGYFQMQKLPMQTFSLGKDASTGFFSIIFYFATSQDFLTCFSDNSFTQWYDMVFQSIEPSTSSVYGTPSPQAEKKIAEFFAGSVYHNIVGWIGHGGFFLHSWELIYFDGRGLAEVPRMLFALANMMPGRGYEDTRLSREQFNQMKADGLLKSNLDRVPILKHNNQVIGQSPAIARYLSKKLGFMGQGDLQAAQVDAICEHVRDIKDAWRKVMPYRVEMTDEEKATARDLWFDTPATPALENRGERQLEWFVSLLESIVAQKAPYSVGDAPTLADVYIYNLLAEHAPELGAAGEPFGSLKRTQKVISNFPNVKALLEQFVKHPGIKTYLDRRGKQNF